MIKRRKTRQVEIGGLKIGGDAPVVVEGMLKKGLVSLRELMAELTVLVEAGCELVRVALPSRSAITTFKRLLAESPIPVMADVHYSWTLARMAIDAGTPSVRINPGNMRRGGAMRRFAINAESAGVVVRIGSNSGSVAEQGKKHTLKELVDAVLDFVRAFEDEGLVSLIVGAKSSSVVETVEANRALADECDHPLHIGITATGMGERAIVKSAIAVGSLLLGGLGDSLRISLTDTSDTEVRLARHILQALKIRSFEPEIISCPTCSRCRVDLKGELKKAEDKLLSLNSSLTVAVMGCVVNGIGEGREADFGVAFGAKRAVLFSKGKRLGFFPNSEAIDKLLEKIYESQK